MAIQTIYILGTAATSPNWWGVTQLNGSAPTAANSAYGWAIGKTAITTPYYRGRLGATAQTGTAVASSYNAGTTAPAPGTGVSGTTASDSFIVGPLSGTFANTAWTFNWNVRGTTAGAVGHVNMRMWRGTNVTGAGATQVLANTAGATVTLSTTADTNSLITASPGAMTLNNEYLWFQVEWQETVVGTSNNDNVLFHIGTASITTADYVAACIGTLAVTELADTLAATGSVPYVGTLNVTEIADTLVGHGGPRVGGTLNVTEIADTLVGHGGPRVGGTLNVTEIADTLVATGVLILPVTGTLAVTEISDTLVATAEGPAAPIAVAPWPPAFPQHGAGQSLGVTNFDAPGAVQPSITGLVAVAWPPAFPQHRAGQTTGVTNYTHPGAVQPVYQIVATGITGTLAVTETADTLSATGTVPLVAITGTLSVTESPDTVTAAGTVQVRGTLNLPQAAQTLVATAGLVIGGTLNQPQAAQTLSATGTVRVSGTLNLPQVPQTLAATGVVFSGLNGTLNLTETPDTLSATGTVFAATDPTLIAYWELSDGSGIDQSGHSNDGIFHGSVTPSTDGPMSNGAVFTTSGYVSNDQVVNISYVTVAVWVRPIPSGRNQQIVGFADGFAAGTTDKDLVLNANGTLSWYIYVSGGIWLTTTATITDGKWHHVVGTYENGTIAIYIDGVLSASTPGFGGSFAGYSQPNVFLGGVGHPNAHGDDWYVGSLDDFRLYNRALSATEVAALYAQGHIKALWSPSNLGSDLLAWLDASDAATITITGSGVSEWDDKSGHALNATQATDAARPLSVGNRMSFSGSEFMALSGYPVIYDYIVAGRPQFAGGYRILMWSGNGAGLMIDPSDNAGVWTYQGFRPAGALTWPTGVDGIAYGSISNAVNAQVSRDGGALQAADYPVQLSQPISLCRNDYGQPFGDISELIFVTYGASLDTKQKLEGYIAWKWALRGLLSVDHPYKFAPPVAPPPPPPVTGDLAVNQANQTCAATGTVLVRGILTPQTQADQTLAATGALTVGGALTQPQAAQTLTAHGTVLVTGALAQPQDGQTITALGGVIVGGTLNQPQAPQTLVAAGGPRVSGILNQPQANQTLAATAGPVVTGTLNTLQADQTVSAHGGPFVLGTLITPQAAQTLAATAGPRVGGTLTQPQANQTLAAAGTLTLRGILTVSQADQALAATASVLTGVGGSLDLAQANQTLAATATVPIWVVGNLNTGQAPQTVSAHGGPRIGGTLSATQADQVVAATASAVAGGALVTPQANQTLTALGGVLVTGHLTQPQAPHTLIAGAGPVNYANLTANQANQTIAATGTVLVRGRLTATQDDHSFAGVLVAPIGGALAIVQDAQVLVTTGTIEVRGTLVLLEHSDTVTALGATSIGAALNLTERSDTLAGRGGSAIEAALTVVETDDILTAVASAHDFNADLFIRQADQRVYAWGYLGDQMPAPPVAGTGTGRYIVVGKDDHTVVAGPTDRLAESVAVNRTVGNGAGAALPARTVAVGASKRAA